MSSELPVPPDQPAPMPAQEGAAPPTPPPPPPPPPESAVKFTRAASLWSALTAGFLILIVLLTFVAQNPDSVPFHFLGWHWRLQQGVAILLAAIGGGLITVLAGTARIFQLRRAAKKNLAAGQTSGL